MRLRPIWLIAAATGVLAIAVCCSRWKREEEGEESAEARGRDVAAGHSEPWRSRPADWDVVDEASDASFPASDPPGFYGYRL